MKKNVSAQVIGAQMVSASDGSAFTGTVTVRVTVDAGAQNIGGTSAGICTHEGNGYHTYVPTQAETNGDLIAFTFTGTGAIPQTLQVYTMFPQTGDTYAALPSAATIADTVLEEVVGSHAGVAGSLAAYLTTATNEATNASFYISGLIQGPYPVGPAGNDTTHVHMQAMIYADDGLNDYQVTILDSGNGILYARWVNDWTLSTQLATVDVLPFTPDTDDLYWLTMIRRDTSDTSGTTTLLSRLTSTRAGYLDNLSGGDVALQTTAQAIQTKVNSIYDFVDTEIADILTDTGTTLDDLVDDLESRLTAALATQLSAHSLGVGRGVVDVGSTTSSLVIKSVNGAAADATNDHYNGRHIVFTSGVLLLQACSITDYVGATKTATISTVTDTPVDDMTFIIV